MGEPVVLLIDDNPDEITELEKRLRSSTLPVVMDPGSLTESELNRADIVLVDQTLSDWADGLEIGLPK